MLYTESAKLWHKCYMDSFHITSSRIQRKGGRKRWSERRRREKGREEGMEREEKEGERKGRREGGKAEKGKGKEKEGKGERERRKRRVKKNSILPTKIKNNSSINLDSLILNVSFYGRNQRL